ncbi:hypothetical protein [Fibrobacter sp.]|uniref:hypothetical protein n=1 Tax=Fibrobacter sp. TaxID=35828 RepID=UPI003870861D
MNVISAQNLFKNIEFQGPCDLNNDTIGKVFRTRELLETILKPENASKCELDADENSDFANLLKDIAIGMNVVDMLGDREAFYTPMMATWKAMSEEIDEYFDAYDGLKAAYQALLDAEIRFMEE